MCGRTCLTLEPNDIKCTCKYLINSVLKEPEWRSEFNLGKTYVPSYNTAPTDITPVLVSADHFREAKLQTESSNERLIVPMMWGMIPFWHKGDYKKHGLTTNNCRLEHMLESKLYKNAFKKGQRCVILCEGFYEWQTTKSAKSSERPAYYLHMKQKENFKIYDKSTWDSEECNVNLLKLAGIFDIWQDNNGDKIFSYSVITFESDNFLNWLHHREPAVLENDTEVADWLDFNRVSEKDALKLLKPVKNLSWYQVSNVVNNSRNKNENCNKPIGDVKSKRIQPKSKIMQSWLIMRKRKENELNEKLKSSDDEENTIDNETDDYRTPRKIFKKDDDIDSEVLDKKKDNC